MLGSFYSFIYADGVPGTSWFHDESYRSKMYDIQKFLNISSLGYFAFDFILLCISSSKCDALTMQTFMHHVTGAGGIIFGNYVGGILGSISQLTWITEGSTQYVNAHQLMRYHGVKSGIFYTFNGMMMVASFLIFRITYYIYIIFGHLIFYESIFS